MLLGQRHRRVEADDRERARHMQDGLNHRLADLWLLVIELGRIVPRHAGAVVAMIDVSLVASPVVDPFEDDRRVAPIEVVILEIDAHPLVLREVGATEGVGGEGALVQGDEPVRVLDNPARIDSDVVGHHVG